MKIYHYIERYFNMISTATLNRIPWLKRDGFVCSQATVTPLQSGDCDCIGVRHIWINQDQTVQMRWLHAVKLHRIHMEKDSLQLNSDCKIISPVRFVIAVFISLLIIKYSPSDFNPKTNNTLTVWLYYLPDCRESWSNPYTDSSIVPNFDIKICSLA